MSQPAFDFGDDAELDDATQTYTVAELAGALNQTLRSAYREGVWVRGEITGWHDRGSHAYFTLADDTDGETAVVHVQFFANVRMKLRPLLQKHRLRLGDGMKVRIFGYLDYFAPTGRLGLKMAGVDPRYTLGDIAQGRDEVLRRLVADGLLDANRRVALTPIPLRVGVATSVGSAAWHDFRDELDRSGMGFRIRVVDTRVQGDGAEPQVAAAVSALSRCDDLDVVVVIRGGGARNELAVFDADVIARAIATSPLPVLTGLGHEIDRSVADEVAHTALKTPTACAAALVTRAAQYLASAEDAWSTIQRRAIAVADRCDGELVQRAHVVSRHTHAAVERADERLAVRIDRLASRSPLVLDGASTRLDRATASLLERSHRRLERAADRIALLEARSTTFDPAIQLARGWSITRRDDGSIVRRATDVAVGDLLVTTLAGGTVVSTVTASTAPPAPTAGDRTIGAEP